MTIGYMCVVAMMFIPLLCAAYSKITGKGYDNRNPREFLSKLDGKCKRANFAQMNSFEAFPPFAAAVIIAHQMGAPADQVSILSVSFVIVRIAYVFLYIEDLHIWRSLAWFIGLLLTLALFFVGIK